jgi:hypothetical protein
VVWERWKDEVHNQLNGKDDRTKVEESRDELYHVHLNYHEVTNGMDGRKDGWNDQDENHEKDVYGRDEPNGVRSSMDDDH